MAVMICRGLSNLSNQLRMTMSLVVTPITEYAPIDFDLVAFDASDAHAICEYIVFTCSYFVAPTMNKEFFQRAPIRKKVKSLHRHTQFIQRIVPQCVASWLVLL